MNLSKRIAKLIEAKDPDEIDEWVVDLHIDMATEINTAGKKAQTEFLLARMSEEQLLEKLECLHYQEI